MKNFESQPRCYFSPDKPCDCPFASVLKVHDFLEAIDTEADYKGMYPNMHPIALFNLGKRRSEQYPADAAQCVHFTEESQH